MKLSLVNSPSGNCLAALLELAVSVQHHIAGWMKSSVHNINSYSFWFEWDHDRAIDYLAKHHGGKLQAVRCGTSGTKLLPYWVNSGLGGRPWYSDNVSFAPSLELAPMCRKTDSRWDLIGKFLLSGLMWACHLALPRDPASAAWLSLRHKLRDKVYMKLWLSIPTSQKSLGGFDWQRKGPRDSV